MNEPDINPKLKHCEQEVLQAIRSNDMVKLKEILIREGLEWVDFVPTGNYKPDIWYGPSNPTDSDAPMFSSLDSFENK